MYKKLTGTLPEKGRNIKILFCVDEKHRANRLEWRIFALFDSAIGAER